MPADTARMRAAAERVAASGVWSVPTLTQGKRAVPTEATLAAWMRSSDFDHVAEEDLAAWSDQLREGLARLDEADWALIADGEANRDRLVAEFHRAGVKLLAGTDTPNPFVAPGSSLIEELANLVHAGVPPHAALAAATRDAAEFMGDAGEWGIVAPGARADLVLLKADPLADVNNLTLRSGVMVRGRWLAEADLRSSIEGLVAR